MTSKRNIHLGLFTLMLLALVTAGCGGANGDDGTATETSPDEGTARRSMRVESLVLQPTTFEDIIELTGTVEAVNDAVLSAQSSGTVELLTPLGRRVGQNTVVARLDQGLVQAGLRQVEAQVQNAMAALELAQDNFNRQEPLYRDSIISALEFQNVRTQLNQAEAAHRQAEALYDQAKEQVKNTFVRAPFSGTIEEHIVEKGEQVSPGMSVLRIIDTRLVKVTVGMPERYAGDIQVGTPVQIDFKAYRGERKEGSVSFSGSAINRDNRTFPIEVEVDNADGQLKPEMIAEVFVSRQTLDDVLIIPRAAVLRDEGGTGVYVINTENGTPTARRRTITLGPAYSGRVIVESGLEPGSEVVVLGQTTVTAGDALEVIEQYTRLDNAGVPIK